MRVAEYMNQWLEGKKADLQRATYEAYTIYIGKHINPYFDKLGKSLEELVPMDVKNYVVSKRNGGRLDGKQGGLSKVSVRKHLNVIKQAFSDAVLLGVLQVNPALVVKLPKTDSITENASFISVDEAKKILQAFAGHWMCPLVRITLLYGLRRSEVLGLKWSAVDFENATLTIRHTVVKNLTIEAKDGTKTKSSYRVFPLMPDIAEMLKGMVGENRGKDTYIFARENGEPLRPDSVTRGFQRVLVRKGLQKLRFHDLRHATATILFDNGWEVADVQHWLGHTDIETTMNIYVAYNCTRKLAVGGSLEGLLAD